MKKIPLTKGYEALVDDRDYERLVSVGSWHFDRYAKRVTRHEGVVYMHRFLLNPPSGLVVDHIDGNKLNNQRHNLRVVSQQINHLNSNKWKDRYRGVSWDKRRRKWKAVIGFHSQTIDIGRFDTSDAAALAYNHVAKQLFGDEAPQNVVAKEVIE